MLIEVFGEWINPDNIAYLRYRYNSNSDTLIMFTGFNDDENSLGFSDKTPDEIAEEINRQLRTEPIESNTITKEEKEAAGIPELTSPLIIDDEIPF